METRQGAIKKAPHKYTEAEIEELRNTLLIKENQLREQSEMIRNREEEKERELETIRRGLEDKDAELSRRYADLSVQELMQARPDDAQLKTGNRDISPPVHVPPRYLDATNNAYFPAHDSWNDSPAPRVSFREALETVPHFDGHNVSLTQFIRACRRAKEIIPLSSERNLTQLLINKLRGRAYYAVEDEPCNSVTQLIDLLSGAFGAAKTIDQYRGELSTIFIKPGEHMLDYVSRVKDLRTTILDAERRQRGTMSHTVTTDVDALTARSFCEGLPLEYRLQLQTHHYSKPFEAFSYVKVLAKRRELDRERFEPVRRYERETGRRDLHPIGRPLAHSTPSKQTNPYIPHPRRPINNREDAIPRVSFRDVYNRAGPTINPQRDPARRDNTRNEVRRYETSGVDRTSKFCKYCKHPGHEIEECRKRQYNNSRQGQGNSAHPSRPSDEPRVGPSREPSRPINTIKIEATDVHESRS